jgi:hypothetical protein
MSRSRSGRGGRLVPAAGATPPGSGPSSHGAGGGGRATGRFALPRLIGRIGGLTTYVRARFGGSIQFHQEVAQGLLSIPFDIHEFLYQEGHKFEAGDLVVNMAPHLRGQQPRGYVSGLTWENAPGCFLPAPDKRALVAERVLRQGQLRSSMFVDALVREETAHSLDWALGGGITPVSHTDPAFSAAYQAEAAAVTSPAERTLLRYYLQAGTAGQEETFAALFAIMYGGLVGYPAFQRLVEQRFAQTLQAVRALVPAP